MTAARRGPGLALVLATALSACAAPPGGPTDDAVAAYDAALATLARDRTAGEAALLAFLDGHRRSALADDALLELAHVAAADGRHALADARLRDLLAEHPGGDRSDEARLLRARLLRRLGESDAAYAVASELRLSRLDPATRRDAERLLADLAGERGELAARLRWLGRVRADAPDAAAAAAVDAEIDAAFAGLDPLALESLAARLGERPPVARLRLRQAAAWLERGRPAAARASLDALAGLPLTAADAARAEQLEARLSGAVAADPLLGLPGPPGAADVPLLRPDPSGLAGTLGAVLPLSGPFAAYGEETLQGLLLALGLFEPEPEAADDDGVGGTADPRAPPSPLGVPAPPIRTQSGLRLLVRDSAGDPARAAEATAELAADPGVVAVVGPLLGRAAHEAASVAEARGLPLLTLTRRQAVAAAGRHVLRLGATAAIETAVLADYAVDRLGAARFALLYPDDDYGVALRGAFWDAVEARGGEVVGVARYPAGATDFAGPIRRLIGYEMLSSAERQALAERARLRKRAKRLPPEEAIELRREAFALTGPEGEPLPPFVDFDALFLPDSYEAVALIAPHLAFHEVRGVRLLGLSGWNDPELVEIGGRHLNGAVFTADFWAGSGSPHVVDFARRFEGAFGREPSFLAAQAYDAASLVLVQLAAGRDEREEVLAGILGTGRWLGVSGAAAIDADGNARKRPSLLGIEDGRIVSLDEREEPPELPPVPVRPWELDACEEGEVPGVDCERPAGEEDGDTLADGRPTPQAAAP